MDGTRELDWLSIIRRATGIAALVVAVAVVLTWVLQFTIVEPVLDAVGAEFIGWTFSVLYWLKLGGFLVVLAGLIVGWRLERPVWARGVTLVALGMVVLWGWELLVRNVDLWGWSRLGEEQLQRVPPDPEVLRIGYVSVFAAMAVEAIAVALLLVGAVRLLRADRAREPAPAAV